MGRFYRNEYLFSEVYFKEVTKIDENLNFLPALSTLQHYRETADLTSLQAWNDSFVYEVLQALKFGMHRVDEHLMLLYQPGIPDEIISLCYVVLPSEDLDNTTMGRNWAEKLIRHLRQRELKWGILTNGNYWRIYHTEEAAPYEQYLEIDLRGILEAEDAVEFQIFYQFMKAENFSPSPNPSHQGRGNSSSPPSCHRGRLSFLPPLVGGVGGGGTRSHDESVCQFDLFKKASQEKIAYIEQELENALKQREEGGKDILSNLCMGYVEFLRKTGNPDFADDVLRGKIYGSAMFYMFQLLFLFYTDARNLLTDVDHEHFTAICHTAKENHTKSLLDNESYALWEQLHPVFENIDVTYSGGLFNPEESQLTQFIEESKISDRYLSPVLFYMIYYEDKAGNVLPISYRDMGVQHLGTLYEGLLEYKLFVAEEDIEVRFSKKAIKFIPASQDGKIKQGKNVPAGHIYFGNDKRERKTSGAYYTPEYIVEYIVQNTIGAKLQEVKDDFVEHNRETLDSLKTTSSEEERRALTELLKTHLLECVNETILNLNVLDPAMGSGFFLVNAVNHLANFTTTFLNDFDIIADEETSTRRWRRRIVEHCIYGVDINSLAVELAKLSLWILSMAKDQSLPFLNHHLKCGNSLIGAQLREIGSYPLAKQKPEENGPLGFFERDKIFQAPVQEVIARYQDIAAQDPTTYTVLENKAQWLEEVNITLQPYKAVFDFHTSLFFGNTISLEEYENTLLSFTPEFTWDGKSFFHWELEFPEVMLKEKGFDVVIGNPPYITYSLGKGSKKSFSPDLSYFINKWTHSCDYKINSFAMFYELACQLLNNNGQSAYIVPGTILINKSLKNIRKYLIEGNYLKIYHRLDYRVFQNAEMGDCAIVFIQGKNPKISEHVMSLSSASEEGLLFPEKSKIRVNSIQSIADYRLLPNEHTYNFLFPKKSLIPLNQVCKFYNGIKTGNNKEFLSDKKLTTQHLPVVRGRDFSGYSEIHQEMFVLFDKSKLWSNYDEKKLRVQSKILIRQTGDRIHATLDDKGFLVMDTVHIIYESLLNLKILLAIMNSKFFNYLHKLLVPETGKTFAEIKITNLKRIHIPKIEIIQERNSKKSLSVLVDQMLVEHKHLSTAKTKQDQELYHKQIELIDRQIDSLVYKLYGLTEEEIQIVEGDLYS